MSGTGEDINFIDVKRLIKCSKVIDIQVARNHNFYVLPLNADEESSEHAILVHNCDMIDAFAEGATEFVWGLANDFKEFKEDPSGKIFRTYGELSDEIQETFQLIQDAIDNPDQAFKMGGERLVNKLEELKNASATDHARAFGGVISAMLLNKLGPISAIDRVAKSLLGRSGAFRSGIRI